MTVSDILLQCRFRLGDTNTTGWTDERLLSLIDQGQRDFSIITGILKAETIFTLTTNNIVVLPTKALIIDRLELDNVIIPMYTREYVDSLILRDTTYTEGSNTASRLSTQDNEVYNYCVKDNLNHLDIETHLFSTEELEAVPGVSKDLKVYYSTVPTPLTDITDVLEITDIWLTAMVHYVVGKAKQDDNDEGSYQLGTAELDKYAIELQKATALVTSSYTKTKNTIRLTEYKGLNYY